MRVGNEVVAYLGIARKRKEEICSATITSRRTYQPLHCCRGVVEVHEAFTVPALMALLHEGAEFDFVYIDASHTHSDTLLDAMLTWRMVATGGVVVFDDYQWPNHPR